MKNLKSSRKLTTAVALSLLTAAAGFAQDAGSQPGATQPAATQPATILHASTQPTTQPDTQPPTPPAAPRADGKVLLNFHNASMDAVLMYLSESAGLTVINDNKFDLRVNVVNKQPMSIDEAIDVLDTLLKDRGFAAVRKGKTLKIVPLDSAKHSTIQVHTGNDPDKIPETDEVITQVIPLRSADATQLKRDLASLVPPYADLQSNTSTNTLVLTDTSANVHRMVQIIKAMDTTVTSIAQVKVFTLKFANATSAARLLTDIFKTDQTATNQPAGGRGGFARFFGGGGGGGGFGGFPGGGGGGGGGATANEDGTKPQVKVTASADDRTNTLVVSAPTDVMPVIEDVIKQLDANPAEAQAVFTYHLRNAQATNVQNVLNSLFGTSSTGSSSTSNNNRNGTTGSTSSNGSRSTTSGSGSSIAGLNLGTSSTNAVNNRNNAPTATAGAAAGGARLSPGSATTAADLTGQVYSVADPDTNSVLVMTASSNFERVKAVLLELDRPIQQVLIKVLLAEVTHSDDKDLGVEFSALNLRTSTGKNQVFSDFGLSNVSTGGLIAKVVDSTEFGAILVALQTVGKLDVLSRPYILASDNQTATITVGQTVPFITNSRLTDTGQTVNTIQYQDIGIILTVTPHINPDGIVTMDVSPEISSISDQTVPISDTVNATVFNKRAAQTRVAIADGQTIVIGGLMQDQKTQTTTKIPFLGDIPYLGLLFQRNQTNISKTELLIFLTPHVAKSPDRLLPMSDEERKGVLLVPRAVAPGVYQQHIDGMQRGADPGTQPADDGTQISPLAPSTQPAGKSISPTTRPYDQPSLKPVPTTQPR